MDTGTLVILVVVLLLFLLASGIWVGIGCFLLGIFVLSTKMGFDQLMAAVSWQSWVASTNIFLCTVPLFIFMGNVLMESGLSKRVYSGMEPLLNHFPGGLLHTNIIVGALFAAASGSAIASAATIGSVAMPEMRKRGYPFGLSIGSVGAGAILSPLIPPSILMIFYAVATEQSIGRLFIAGVLPGLLLAALFMLYIGVNFRFYGNWQQTRSELIPWKASLIRTKDIWVILILVFLVLGTIYLGVATATEAAAVGCVGVLALALGHRVLTWKVIRQATLGTVKLTAQVMLIYLGAKLLASSMAIAGLVGYVTKILISLPVAPVVVIILVYLLYLILGMFVDTLPLLLMTVPLVFPAVVQLGYDPIWFGVVTTVCMIVGHLSPPVGMTLFVLQALTPERPATDVWKGITPFIIVMLVCLAILTAFPSISLWLPNRMFGR